MDINNGENKGEEIESPFDETEVKEKKLNRVDLINNHTGKELAKMVNDRGLSTLKLSTLERIGKNELVDILLEIKKPNDVKSKSRTSTAKSESDDIINFAMNTLQGIKQARKGQEAVINPIALDMFKNSAVSKVDEARASGTLDNDKLNTTIFAVSGAIILIDTLIGFDNVPNIFRRFRDKFKKKQNENETDTK